MIAAALLALASPLLATASGPIPDDVARCIEKKAMWVSNPRFFEALTFTDGKRREQAVQILDRHEGNVGHLLVFPRTCRIVVLAFTPSAEPMIRTSTLLTPDASAAEREMLRRWARLGDVEATDPRVGALAAAKRTSEWTAQGQPLIGGRLSTWTSKEAAKTSVAGRPVPQRRASEPLGGPVTKMERRVALLDGFRAPERHLKLGDVELWADDHSDLPRSALAVYDAAKDATRWIHVLDGPLHEMKLVRRRFVAVQGAAALFIIDVDDDYALHRFEGLSLDQASAAAMTAVASRTPSPKRP